MTTYNSIEDVPAETSRDLMEGIALLARKLRQWRDFGSLHELRASVLAADGEIVLICHHDDRITLVEGNKSVDLTEWLERQGQ